METLTKYRLAFEIDETFAAITGIATKASSDPFHDHDAELKLRATLADAWDKRLVGAHAAAQHIASMSWRPSVEMIPHIVQAFRSHLSGASFTSSVRAGAPIADAFAKGKAQVTAHAPKKSMSRLRVAKNDFFGLLFGMTESHATKALQDQLMLSAGGFFDDEMADVVRNAVQEWFDGELTRDELIDNLKQLTNNRLATSGQESLPKSYFEGLAEHYIVRSRNFGSIYQADNLGLKKYKIQGILDHRTSSICRPLIEGSKTFTLAGAKDKMNDILKIRNLSTLKQKYPFLTEPSDAVHPIPPLHWRCRSWMEYEI